MIEHLGIRVLLSGDATKESWKDILEYHGPEALDANVFLAPHHGSSDNIEKDVFSHIDPEYVVVSDHHGHQYDYAYYNQLAREQVYSTKHFGNITVEVSEHTKRYSQRETDNLMMVDQYSLKARYAPAILTIIIPIFLFNHFFVSVEFSKFVGEIFGAKVLSNLTISGICLYFFSELGRMIGKNLFESRFFREETEIPTTNFALFSDSTYSAEYKNKFRERVWADFSQSLPSEEEEEKNQPLARTKIVEAMALVRKKLMGNKFLLQHNIEYGAMRNAIGGAVLGLLMSAANIWFFSKIVANPLAVTLSWCTLGIYFLLVALSKPIIEFYGRNYAKVLFREYMGAS